MGRPRSASLASASAAVAALAVLAGGSAARADAPAVALGRLLRAPGKAHPLVDRAGRVAITVRLAPGADARALGLLPVAPGIGAVHLTPDDLEAYAAAHPSLRLLTGPPRRAQLDVSSTWTHAATYRHATGADGTGVVVGLVDTGIDIQHADFRNADGTSRIAWLLAGGPPAGLHPDLEAEYGCSVPHQTACAIYAKADLDAILKAGSTPPVHDLEGHGTHVASIAAGNGGIMTSASPRYVGVAPGATLVVAAPVTSGGGFLDPDILNGARFVFDRATDLQRPAVLNLSVGGDFGPHDGTSLVEVGLSAMVGDDKPGRLVVVAAGNSGALYLIGGVGPFGVHTEAHVSPDSDTRAPILAPVSKTGQGFVWVTFKPGDHVSVGLEGPGGATWVGMTGPGSEGSYTGSDGNTGAVVNDLPSGDPQLPAASNSAIVAWTGAWPDQSEFAVHLSGSGDAQLWVTGEGDVASSTSLGLLFERAMRQGTINVPASAPGLLAVGCTVNRVGWVPFRGPSVLLGSLGGVTNPVADGACYFSAAGPTPAGLPKPELSAPGGFVAAAMSVDADPRTNPGGLFDGPDCPDPTVPCYLVDDTHAVAAGTSMSAPHVAGALALLLQRDPTLTQARATQLLQAGAAYPSGSVPFDYQLGPGELDLQGAEQALAVEQASSVEPDLARSWYVLSSGYARPDPTWPIWGTIELRRPDGSLASGLSGSKLSLDVAGGVVVQGVTKVRDGLFRFAVAGVPGAPGQELTVEVRYAGTSMGSHTLPTGTDVWQARGQTSAVGGCSLAPGAVALALDSPLLLGLALLGSRAIAGARRRGRRA